MCPDEMAMFATCLIGQPLRLRSLFCRQLYLEHGQCLDWLPCRCVLNMLIVLFNLSTGITKCLKLKSLSAKRQVIETIVIKKQDSEVISYVVPTAHGQMTSCSVDWIPV